MALMKANEEKGENISTEDTEEIGEHRDNRSYGRCTVYA